MPELAWFIAAVSTIPLALFLDRGNWRGLAINCALTGLLATVAAWLRSWSARPSYKLHSPTDLAGLLRYVWEYPLGGEPQHSWATKESKVIQGEVAVAAANPGLGIAIITTELAQIAFGRAADYRLDGVVSWALQRCERVLPYLMLARDENSISGNKRKDDVDLRHTMALAIILLRTRRELERAATYIEVALKAQRGGAWFPPDRTSDSTLFTTLYGTELMDLALLTPHLPSSTRSRVPDARSGAIAWLIKNQKRSGLWSTDVFRAEAWDCVMATGWVLHRTLRAPAKLRCQWNECLSTATGELIQLIDDRRTWNGYSEELRFRVEARAAGGIHRTLQAGICTTSVQASARRYLGSWHLLAPERLSRLGLNELDVGTAAFAAWAMADGAELRRVGCKVAAG